MDNFVVLEPGNEEQILTIQETLTWLSSWLQKIDELPMDLKEKSSIKDAAKHLLDTACVLEIKPGFNVQWYAVRLDPSENE
tara:strand:+ start:3025 stop:3267 length:243 start_codon:yes stop_codon:yes gene_type:complete